MKKGLVLAILLFLLPALTSTGAGPQRLLRKGIDNDSLNRVAITAVDSLKALEKLVADINAIVKLPEVKTGNVGIEVKSLSTGKNLYSLNASKPLTPASTTKVVTTFTALCELGSNYMVRTTIAAESRPRDGVVTGNLYVKGHGDPFFSINEIDQLVDRILAAGIKQIDGNIVGDGTFFDEKTERTQYSGDEDVVIPLPPIAALTMEQSVFTVVISSPRTPGVPCNVQTYPSSSGFQIINTAVTTSAPAPRSRKRGKRRSDILVPRTLDSDSGMRYGDESPGAYDLPLDQRKPKKGTPPAPSKAKAAKKGAAPAKATKKVAAAKKTTQRKAAAPAAKQKTAATRTRTAPAKTTAKAEPVVRGAGPIRVSISTGDSGRQVVTVNGSLPPGRTVSYRYQMKNPPLVIAGIIYDRLRSHGVTISGHAVSGASPARARMVIAEAGRPLQEILQIVMKNSNNFLAEYVFKIIGGAAGGQQETAQKTVEKIHQRMSANGIPFGLCIINDGSGLSRANCLSAAALSGILEAAYKDRKVFEPLYQAMSIAGVDGTLRRRMKGTRAEGNVHGKTGTLRNVSALTGYVTTRDGEQICFAMLMNGSNHGAYRAVQDRVAARLAAFSYSEILTAEAK